MSRIIVTGATGHIGFFVLDEIKKMSSNANCVVLSLDNCVLDLPKDSEIVHGNITDRDLIFNLIKKDDIVIHLAGIISINKDQEHLIYDVNYLGTKNIADACLKVGARLIYTSSVHVLNPNTSAKINEEAGFNIESKRGPYEYSKSLATNYIFELFKKGLDGVVLYPSAIIGPNDRYVGEVSNALIMIYKHKMPAYIKGGYSFVDVRDVAHTIVKCALEPKISRQGYILSCEYISIKNLIKLVYSHYNYKHFPMYCPNFLVYLALPFIALHAKIHKKKPIFTSIMLKTVQSNGDFDTTKAKKELDFHTRDLIESIEDQINWLKENHPELF